MTKGGTFPTVSDDPWEQFLVEEAAMVRLDLVNRHEERLAEERQAAADEQKEQFEQDQQAARDRLDAARGV
jgi:hypothetical protein